MDRQEFDDFFAGKSIQFSNNWKAELERRFMRLSHKNTRQYVGSIHDAMILEMINVGRSWLLGRFSSYRLEDIDDIVSDAFLKWQSSFNATKAKNVTNPELSYFFYCVKSAQSDFYNNKPSIYLPLRDEDGSFQYSKKGKIKLVPSGKAVFFSVIENAYDKPDENDEEFTSSDNYLPESHPELLNDALNSNEPINSASDEGVVLVNSDAEEDISIKDKNKELFSWGSRFFSRKSSIELINYLLLSGRMKNGHFKDSFIYKPLKKSIPYQVRPEFDNLSDISINVLNNLLYLKNAENRKWMEMAICELRKSLDRLNMFIKSQKLRNPEFDEIRFRQNTPILSSIAISNDGKYIASCYKGQVTSFIGDRDLTFDKHCEFSLFTEIIKEHNLHLYKDGVLFVTLEPCIKRGFWLDGEQKKPKIPCAVRCVEAGFKKIYIGSLDDNKDVFKKGKEILESGKYIFPQENGSHIGSTKQVEAAKLLEEYFVQKDYPCTRFTDKIVFQIGNPIEVHDFEPDLIEEVRKLNSAFLQRHSPSLFRL